MNHHRIDDRLATGGHFVGDGVAAIGKQGVKVVIDLRDKPPEGQKEKLAAAGIEWVNIPVVWKKPTPGDFDEFRKAMERYKNEHVLVQCQANYRASALTYLYRVAVDGVDEADARGDMNVVWEPDGRWAKYIDVILGDSAGTSPRTEN
jgi:protein tyrosine phosphatase (PTP) superfamily phosphohydrolase (DUF442 family)